MYNWTLNASFGPIFYEENMQLDFFFSWANDKLPVAIVPNAAPLLGLTITQKRRSPSWCSFPVCIAIILNLFKLGCWQFCCASLDKYGFPVKWVHRKRKVHKGFEHISWKNKPAQHRFIGLCCPDAGLGFRDWDSLIMADVCGVLTRVKHHWTKMTALALRKFLLRRKNG